ncbi:hypothetical protein [Streptomyces sp. NPDC056227]|uniref:hypothetical protein n=1 Tax=unclassified Streptomyces TaxID=2593676 RepID=UPI0035DC79D7
MRIGDLPYSDPVGLDVRPGPHTLLRLDPRRHLLTAPNYRAEMIIRFVIWDQITGVASLPAVA